MTRAAPEHHSGDRAQLGPHKHNRALFLLDAIAQCDVVILLEDNQYPAQDGWEQEWVLASQR